MVIAAHYNKEKKIKIHLQHILSILIYYTEKLDIFLHILDVKHIVLFN